MGSGLFIVVGVESSGADIGEDGKDGEEADEEKNLPVAAAKVKKLDEGDAALRRGLLNTWVGSRRRMKRFKMWLE